MFSSGVLLITLLIFSEINANRNLTSTLNTNCTLRYGKRVLKEEDAITIYKKIYKVEDCQLERAYHSCGTHLWSLINIVCGAIESNQLTDPLQRRYRRFTRKKLLIEACCLSTCTVQEMTRYCPF